MFTGDRSGEWLYAALHRAGLANKPRSVSRDDGLRLLGAYITAAVRCAPPANKPNIVERDTCQRFLERELPLLKNAKVLLALGSFGWDAALRTVRALGYDTPRPKPKFGHGAEAEAGPYTLLGSFHPSQQNTFTGKLTEPMLDSVIGRAKELADLS
jgi:uracil-DNA glycosylase family 4